jgi:hypothetical protein
VSSEFATGSSSSAVFVDYTADNTSPPYRRVDRDDHAGVVVRRMLVQTLMWTVSDEVVLVLTQHRAGVLLVVDQHPIGALSPDASHEALGKRVGPRRTRWSLDHLDPLGSETWPAT